MINVLLADDHEIVRRGLKLVLGATEDINVVAEAEDGVQVLQHLGTGVNVHVVLADVVMPGLDGIELAGQINQHYPHIPVLMLTVKDDEVTLHNAVRNGIAGYLTKSADQVELLFAIRQAARRKHYLDSKISGEMMDRIAAPAYTPEGKLAAQLKFSKREMEILLLLADGFSNQQAADKLFTSKRTVEGHRQAMLVKTKTSNASQLVRFAMRAGIIN